MHETVDDLRESRPLDLAGRQDGAASPPPAHRQLVHRHAVAERVLPLGAPPFGHPSGCADVADQRTDDDAGTLPAELQPGGQARRRGQGRASPIHRGAGRTALGRWLMNVHLLWLD